jgi:L,D-peptidoglycan transpeptidase YkuD (ErfK/YbiS/YcfS/YnhG family)
MCLPRRRLLAAIALVPLFTTGCATVGAATSGSGLAEVARVKIAPVAGGVDRTPSARAPKVTQLITVTATSHSSTYARFVAYHWSRGRWVRKFGPWTARVGYNGIARPGAKREGDGKTPSGSYGFSFDFGVLANPGVTGTYRRARSYDWWDDDPKSASYNEWIDTRYSSAGHNPEPMDNQPAYNYGAVIAYNTARVPGRGSAIFLHVGTGSSTAGCVSLPQRELLAVLRWLRPAEHPRITISVKP